MALIIETGQGVVGAIAYADTAYIDSYCAALGLTGWASRSQTEKEAAVMRAMAFIDALPWPGVKYSDANDLAWPRSGATDADGVAIESDEIPSAIKKAMAEGAYIESESFGALQPDHDPLSSVKSEAVDVLKTEYFQPATFGAAIGIKTYNRLFGYLRGLGSGWPFNLGQAGNMEIVLS